MAPRRTRLRRRADTYATAAFVMGQDALAWIEQRTGYEALLLSTRGMIQTSSKWYELFTERIGLVPSCRPWCGYDARQADS